MAERADHAPHSANGDTHQHDRPEDWGWHASFGKWARIGGWLAVVVLLLQNVTTYYNTSQAPWLYGTTAVLVFLLVRDHFRRKNAWRN